MVIEILWWNLKDDAITIAELNRLITEDVIHEWRDVNNLIYKTWIADSTGYKWGAIMCWNGPRAEQLPANLPAGVIGRPPDSRQSFDVVAEVSTNRNDVSPLTIR